MKNALFNGYNGETKMSKAILLVELVTRIPDYGQSVVQCAETSLGLVKALGPRDHAPDDAKLITVKVRDFSYFDNGEVTRFKLAWSPEFENELGLPLDIIERQSYELEGLRGDKESLWARLTYFNNMSFWQRVKFVFTGRVE